MAHSSVGQETLRLLFAMVIASCAVVVCPWKPHPKNPLRGRGRFHPHQRTCTVLSVTTWLLRNHFRRISSHSPPVTVLVSSSAQEFCSWFCPYRSILALVGCQSMSCCIFS